LDRLRIEVADLRDRPLQRLRHVHAAIVTTGRPPVNPRRRVRPVGGGPV
jgi:hypothetical protein